MSSNLPKTNRKRVDTSPFVWTGICDSCGGNSNPYNLGEGRPSRSTVVVAGRQVLADGTHWTYKRSGERAEVCYACKARWKRNKTFLPVRRQLQLSARQQEKLKEAQRLGWTVSEIARALNKPRSSVWKFLSGQAKASSTPPATPA